MHLFFKRHLNDIEFSVSDRGRQAKEFIRKVYKEMDEDRNEKITKEETIHWAFQINDEKEGFQLEVPLTSMWCTMHFIELVLEKDDQDEGFHSEVPLTTSRKMQSITISTNLLNQVNQSVIDNTS